MCVSYLSSTPKANQHILHWASRTRQGQDWRRREQAKKRPRTKNRINEDDCTNSDYHSARDGHDTDSNTDVPPFMTPFLRFVNHEREDELCL